MQSRTVQLTKFKCLFQDELSSWHRLFTLTVMGPQVTSSRVNACVWHMHLGVHLWARSKPLFVQFTVRWVCFLIIHGTKQTIAAQQMRKVWLIKIELSGLGEPSVKGGLFSAYRLVWALTFLPLKHWRNSWTVGFWDCHRTSTINVGTETEVDV